ncbi:hypothetical protein KIN20_013571 [Parelaphostrongylus tenuis]|uniref:Uncharacterized protein n=1 Tax=Parelaphostrongylus tenuis TaxID=148309 RepID=A0AAD5MDS6_PARTN|nr:hypothetical protein KIN20_013571 [Parelaphostrongylus tenuis]
MDSMPLAAEHSTIRGTVSTTNIIMANWVDPNVTECDEQNESLESRNVWNQLEGLGTVFEEVVQPPRLF